MQHSGLIRSTLVYEFSRVLSKINRAISMNYLEGNFNVTPTLQNVTLLTWLTFFSGRGLRQVMVSKGKQETYKLSTQFIPSQSLRWKMSFPCISSKSSSFSEFSPHVLKIRLYSLVHLFPSLKVQGRSFSKSLALICLFYLQSWWQKVNWAS